MSFSSNTERIILTDSVLIYESQPCETLDLGDHKRYYPIMPRPGCITFAYMGDDVEAADLSGKNGWISPLRLRKHRNDSYGYIECRPCDVQVRWTLPSAILPAAFYVSLRATVQVAEPRAFLAWYHHVCSAGEAVMASEVLSGHLQMKAANLTKLYSAGQAAVLEQMLNVVMADTNELSGIGLRVLDSTWIAEAAAPTGAPRFKERPAVWKG